MFQVMTGISKIAGSSEEDAAGRAHGRHVLRRPEEAGDAEEAQPGERRQLHKREEHVDEDCAAPPTRRRASGGQAKRIACKRTPRVRRAGQADGAQREAG